MKLSIVILCWNDRDVIANCLRSIYSGTQTSDFEVIVSDNGSTDGSPEYIRACFPRVRVIENGANLRFAKGNNVGIRAAVGDYIWVLNPDTLIPNGTLDKMIEFADAHPEAGAFGCTVLNSDGTYQESARPFPSLFGDCLAALYLRPLAHLSPWFISDTYTSWHGNSERKVDWLSGCSILLRGDLIKSLGGFDSQFFYYYEDVDLCRRVWNAGYPVLFTPRATITHLGGQSTRRSPLTFQCDSQITRYRYFYKHFGRRAARQSRWVAILSFLLRWAGYRVVQALRPSAVRKQQLETLSMLIAWHLEVDPVELVENGKEPSFAVPAGVRILER
jgi:GT2 family glycosyltransferase